MVNIRKPATRESSKLYAAFVRTFFFSQMFYDIPFSYIADTSMPLQN